jgi:ribosomal protein S18 acetylase RimI-like enzyme
VIRIERTSLADLPGAYRVGLLTGDAGKDASERLRDPDLLGHIYVGPYIVRGDGTQLVAVDEQGVAGYLLSADDTRSFEAWAQTEWWPALRGRYPPRDDGSLDAELIGLIHEPERTPDDLVAEYPAHLHIDLLERTRGRGLGRLLIERLLDELRDRGVPGVHLGVDVENTNGIGFYQHLGFREVAREPGGLLMAMRLS